MPIVLSTVGVGFGFNGPTLPSVFAELDGIDPIDRSSMNAFEDQAFRSAVEATGRKRLIIGALHTEICLTFATVQALKDGYDVLYVADAVGGAPRLHIGPPSTGSLPPAPSRQRRSPWSPSSSGIGRDHSPLRPRTSSTGTSVRCRITPTRWAWPRRRIESAAAHGAAVHGEAASPRRSASSPAPVGAWATRPRWHLPVRAGWCRL